MTMAEAPDRPSRGERAALPCTATGEADGLTADQLRELRHEVGNALAAALGYAEYLLRWRADRFDKPEQQALVTIRDSVRRAASLLAAPAGSSVPVPRDLRDIVRDAVGQLPPERAGDVRFDALPDTPLVGCWDRERVEQVLVNLLSNAAKYSPAGTPISIELRRVDDWVRVIVKDAGIGIGPDDLDAVFSGHRTDRARQMAPGSGQGLQVSRRLAEAERGRLWANSVPAVGSTFCLDLPLPGSDQR